MTDIDDMPDEILRKILSRLPPKPMGQSRCVSKRWNRLISDPSFMMSRPSSRLTLCRHTSDRYNPIMFIKILDGSNGSVTNVEFSTFKDLPTMRNWDDRFIKIVGTFSGIILLAVKDLATFDVYRESSYEEHIILFNPFTGIHEIFKDPYSPLPGGLHLYGFGYGAAPDEMKLVRFRRFRVSGNITSSCEVLNLKTRSWSKPAITIPDGHFEGYIGTFLKGYLYWMISSKIMALDVDKMVISYLHQPDSTIDKESYLGTCNGRLWMITNTDDKTLNFDVWVMKEQGVGNSWSKACSFAVGLEPPTYFSLSHSIEITEDGRIIVFINKDDYRHMFIYDTSKNSSKLLECQEGEEEGEEEEEEEVEWGFKYKESLISPINICRV
uniref:F-box/kelch-repeat protein At3g06240-like n=1 Tax=Erigeron canadensis TaxID=72917 RepID=UPI001CB89B27|nr:F-box/kelch-repeat protein At3g06240-like [Erigeron canadensis]XP_043614022.1 F-box/kelch-repeat protein At3g06240-like [Erigeron canadensis]